VAGPRDRSRPYRSCDGDRNWTAASLGADRACFGHPSVGQWCGFYAYRHATRPTTVTVAAGSSDGEAVRLMSAIASRMAATSASVRLNVLDKGNALDAVKAFSAGQADLAVARADIGDLSSAEMVVVVTRAVVLIAPRRVVR